MSPLAEVDLFYENSDFRIHRNSNEFLWFRSCIVILTMHMLKLEIPLL